MPKPTRQSQKNSTSPSAEPKASRPQMPKQYGMVNAKNGKGLLPWSYACERIEKARNYWICTTRPDGRPHSMPVWGVWVEDAFYFGTDPQSRKARNLASNPALVVHLESGDDVVILEGKAEEIRVTDKRLLEQLDKGSFEKDKIHVMGPQGQAGGLYRMKPRVAFAWREQDFNSSATRWTFD
jgi:Pyridoxamine 5'-phosphate oxidase